jgi:hypothetical protein
MNKLHIIIFAICIFIFLGKINIIKIDVPMFVFVCVLLLTLNIKQTNNLEHLTTASSTSNEALQNLSAILNSGTVNLNNVNITGKLTAPDIVTTNVSSSTGNINLKNDVNVNRINMDKWAIYPDGSKNFILRSLYNDKQDSRIVFTPDAYINFSNKTIQTDNINNFNTNNDNKLQINGIVNTTGTITSGDKLVANYDIITNAGAITSMTGNINTQKAVNIKDWSLYQDDSKQMVIRNNKSSDGKDNNFTIRSKGTAIVAG